MRKIESAVIDFYQSQELGSDQASALLRQSRHLRKRRWVRKVLPLSAVASLSAILLAGGMYFSDPQSVSANNIVLQEASINHRSKLQLDFNSPELPVLSKVMTKLDFPLLLPESMRQQFEILGARYCTLNGNIAAHIKLNSNDSEGSVSLFMTQNRKDLAKLADHSEDVDGINISTWTADGMFYVLASN